MAARPENLALACVYSINGGMSFTSLDEVKNYLLTLPVNSYVFAHNAEYDYTGIFGSLLNIDTAPIYVNSRLICCKKNKIYFCDSMNILPFALKEIGKQFGLDKLSISKKFITGKRSKISRQDIAYCMRDCELLYKALLRVFTLCGKIKMTIGGISLHTFQSQFDDKNYFTGERNQTMYRNAYYGGRTECFIKGACQCNVYDVNSLYPFTMRDTAYPNPLYHYSVKKPTLKQFEDILKDFEGCVYMSCTHKKSMYGYLPLRDNGKLIFPNGKLSGWWCFPEIRKALQDNILTDIDIHFVCYSTRIKSPFKRFIDTYYKKRLASEGIDKTFYKLVLNNLYGKYGQGKPEKRTYFTSETQSEVLSKIKKGRIEFFKHGNGGYVITDNSNADYPRHTAPQFAAYITSAARVLMLNHLLYCDKHNIDLHYMDTDSLFIPDTHTLPTGKNLGQLKLEDKQIDFIHGLKNYTYTSKGETHTLIKGVHKKAIKTGANQYTQKQMIKLKQAQRSGKEAGHFVDVVKNIKNINNKRIFKKNNSLPISLK